MADASGEHDELVYEAAGLPKTTNWWGAFVIGLAGTILVTGIAPVMVTQLGAASVPVIVLITISDSPRRFSSHAGMSSSFSLAMNRAASRSRYLRAYGLSASAGVRSISASPFV